MLTECCGNCKHSQKRDSSDIKENKYRLYPLKCMKENPLYVSKNEHCLRWELKGE